MPGTLTIDTGATFQTVLLMASGPKLKFGSTEQDISARGERKWDVQAAVTYHAEPGMKAISEVIAVTVTGPGTDPCASIPAGTSIVFDRLRVGFSVPEAREKRPRDPWRPSLVSGRRRAPGSPGPPGEDRGRITPPARPGRCRPPLAWPGIPLPEVPVPFLVLPAALWLADPWHDALVVVLVLVAARPATDLIRFAAADSAARRHYLGMVRARHRWHWLCRCTGPAQPELAARNRPDAESRALALVLLSTVSRLLAIVLGIEAAERVGRIHYPRAKRWRLTGYGWQCVVKTAPRTGRKEVDKQAAHIADYWRSVRVGVTQAAPGRLIVRALREDPLAVPFGPEECPPGTFEPHIPDVLYVGRDDFGTDRYLPLHGLTGVCVSGLPGYGKTSLISSWLCQLTTTPAAQFALLDGKDGGDQEPWHDRAWRHAGTSSPTPSTSWKTSTPPCAAASAPSPASTGSATHGMPAAPPTTSRSWSP